MLRPGRGAGAEADDHLQPQLLAPGDGAGAAARGGGQLRLPRSGEAARARRCVPAAAGVYPHRGVQPGRAALRAHRQRAAAHAEQRLARPGAGGAGRAGGYLPARLPVPESRGDADEPGQPRAGTGRPVRPGAAAAQRGADGNRGQDQHQHGPRHRAPGARAGPGRLVDEAGAAFSGVHLPLGRAAKGTLDHEQVREPPLLTATYQAFQR